MIPLLLPIPTVLAVSKLPFLQGHGRSLPSFPYRVAVSQQYSVDRFATLRFLNCLHSRGLRCQRCNVCCEREERSLVAATKVWQGSRDAHLYSGSACLLPTVLTGISHLFLQCPVTSAAMQCLLTGEDRRFLNSLLNVDS